MNYGLCNRIFSLCNAKNYELFRTFAETLTTRISNEEENQVQSRLSRHVAVEWKIPAPQGPVGAHCPSNH